GTAAHRRRDHERPRAARHQHAARPRIVLRRPDRPPDRHDAAGPLYHHPDGSGRGGQRDQGAAHRGTHGALAAGVSQRGRRQQPGTPGMMDPAQIGQVFDVVGIGANSVDYVYQLPAYPERDGPNAKMRISSHSLSCGGQVATALCTCTAMGLRTKYIGATGTDDNGRRLRDELARRDVDMSDAVIRDVTNQFAVIMVDEQAGERIVLWDRHEGLTLRPRELPPEILMAAHVVHVDDVDQDAAIRAARM